MPSNNLRAALIAELQRVYFEKQRKGSMAEDMADAVLAVIAQWETAE